MKSIRDIPALDGVPVLVRMSQAINEVRIQAALPTIKFLRERGARVILASHASGEDAKTGIGTQTLQPMYEALKSSIPNLSFCPVAVGEAARAAARELPSGGVLLLENLRRNAGEVRNDPAFAAELAELADVFVQDSFDTCHRKHASIVGVPALLPSYAGFAVEKEVKELGSALNPASPSLAVICGAKFSTKVPVLTRLLEIYDQVFVGGALANDFLKAKGYTVGSSLVSDADSHLLEKLLKNPKLLLPVDVVVAPNGSKRDTARVAALHDVKADEAILDAGPETSAMLALVASRTQAILWNGPLGNFENGFIDATRAFAEAVSASGAYSVVGGGDTIEAFEVAHIAERFSFISTGGGAMLDFLVDGTLPGLEALG